MIVYENNMYKVEAAKGHHDKPESGWPGYDTYIIINKMTGLEEEEEAVLFRAVLHAFQYNYLYDATMENIDKAGSTADVTDIQREFEFLSHNRDEVTNAH